MDAQRKWTVVLATIAVFVMAAAFLPGLICAGNLEPEKAPGSTMHTLGEIYDKLVTVETNIEPCGGPCEPCKEAPVAKTGQITSYAAGDDGDLGKGAWSQPRFTDNGDHTVTDNLTGLMWMQGADMFASRAWNEALSACASCEEGGHDDWRLPNVKELQSLIDYGQYRPALAGSAFGSIWGVYWSSTTIAFEDMHGEYFNPNSAWVVDFEIGRVDFGSKDESAQVWCVRGGR